MRLHTRTLASLLTVWLLSSLFPQCAHRPLPEEPSTTASSPSVPVDFLTEIKPLLANQCLPCHHQGTLLSDFNIETRANALSEGPRGPHLIPGDPEASRFWNLVNAPHPLHIGEDRMPSHGPRLTEAEKALLYRWIQEGAAWPSGPEGRLVPLQSPHQA